MGDTWKEEYRRLEEETVALLTAVRRNPGQRTATAQRLRAVRARVKELLAIPPEGYAVPEAAADLVQHAKAYGWKALVQWTPPGSAEAFVVVQVGRLLQPGEQSDAARGDRWLYGLTWHSRGCTPGRLRLFSRLAQTPDHPWHHDGPSVKRIRQVIADHPLPGATGHSWPEP